MAQTSSITCPKGCGVDVLALALTPPNSYVPYVTVNAIPNPTGHVIETGVGTGRTLKVDRSDAGGATVYKAHHLTCSA
jgi:hypothetical protein